MYDSLQFPDLEVHLLGERALLFRRKDVRVHPLALPRLGEALARELPPGVVDVIATEVELMVLMSGCGLNPDLIVRDIEARFARVQSIAGTSERSFRLPVCFDLGSDWDRVCEETATSREMYEQHALAIPFHLTMYGFVPGFLYMGGLPEELRCPRKATPDKSADAGSVAVGGPYLGIYSLATPAGWNVIGRTPIQTFEATQLPPTPFRIGDAFRLERISADEYEQLRRRPPSGLELRNDD